MTKKKIGKHEINKNASSKLRQGISLAFLFDSQFGFQQEVLGKEPKDDVDWFKYHICALSEEIGEVLKADKRWKTHRNERYERAEKIDELADVLITVINLCIFSGCQGEQMANAVYSKILENFEKLKAEKEKNNGIKK